MWLIYCLYIRCGSPWLQKLGLLLTQVIRKLRLLLFLILSQQADQKQSVLLLWMSNDLKKKKNPPNKADASFTYMCVTNFLTPLVYILISQYSCLTIKMLIFFFLPDGRSSPLRPYWRKVVGKHRCSQSNCFAALPSGQQERFRLSWRRKKKKKSPKLT